MMYLYYRLKIRAPFNIIYPKHREDDLEKMSKSETSRKMLEIAKEYIHNNPKIKKTIGVILILVGFVALITPLTPGSWLAIIGLELLGVRILFFDKLKFWGKK